jgi:hypothetical protein
MNLDQANFLILRSALDRGFVALADGLLVEIRSLDRVDPVAESKVAAAAERAGG